MRRITTWLVATLAVVAMITYYQVSLAGDGKSAERAGSGAATAECGAPRPQTTPTAPAASPSGDDKASDPCADSDHSAKPAESK